MKLVVKHWYGFPPKTHNYKNWQELFKHWSLSKIRVWTPGKIYSSKWEAMAVLKNDSSMTIWIYPVN